MSRLVPAYVEKPAWAVYDAFVNFNPEATDALDDLSEAVSQLRLALARADAFTHAPAYVRAQEFGGAAA